MLDVNEAAEFLRVKTDTLSLWLSTNKYPQLKSVKIGRYRRFLKHDLVEFLESLSHTNAEWIRRKV
ncbi:MAG: helix-turn-helix domain-containing protein [Puniceicoccales bacterium]|nr:helix-turn-helix domain-containing protein [Puniceicoccales bacterium]